MNLLRQRSQIVAALRGVLEQEGYREVETPMLSTVHGGANARPFRTRSNAYGMDLTLRIAPELQLKRLLVAGAGPIFEIGRNFRNEGQTPPTTRSSPHWRPIGRSPTTWA